MRMTTAEEVRAIRQAVFAAFWIVVVVALSSAYFHVPLDTRPCLYADADSTWVSVDPGYRVCHHGDPDALPLNLGFWP